MWQSYHQLLNITDLKNSGNDRNKIEVLVKIPVPARFRARDRKEFLRNFEPRIQKNMKLSFITTTTTFVCSLTLGGKLAFAKAKGGWVEVNHIMTLLQTLNILFLTPCYYFQDGSNPPPPCLLIDFGRQVGFCQGYGRLGRGKSYHDTLANFNYFLPNSLLLLSGWI
jgi:hypothetical protein